MAAMLPTRAEFRLIWTSNEADLTDLYISSYVSSSRNGKEEMLHMAQTSSFFISAKEGY